jgi:acyl-CoA reductase-like NAD-dependent aldehyde dehydrogenase
MSSTNVMAVGAAGLASVPAVVFNQVDGRDVGAAGGLTFAKIDPATGRELCQVARSTRADVDATVAIAKRAQPAWAALTPVTRGDILRRIAILMQ